MRNIFKEIILVGGIFLGLYAGLWVVTFVFYPERANIDSEDFKKTIFTSQAKYVALDIWKIAKPRRGKIILVGSSNVREGFRPLDIEDWIANQEVHNLAIGASNITQLAQIVQLALTLPKETWDDSIVVIGVWYGLFVDDNKQWAGSPTTFMSEALRYGFYRQQGERLYPVVPWRNIPCWESALRPYLLLTKPVYGITYFGENIVASAHTLVREKKIDYTFLFPNPSQSHETVDEKYKANAIKFWMDYLGTPAGTLQDEQFIKLRELLRQLQTVGARVVLVDMPLPAWHRASSTYYAAYKQKIYNLYDEVKYPGLWFLDLSEKFGEEKFYDSAHPFQEAAKEWAKALGIFIQRQVIGNKDQDKTVL